MSQTDTSPTFYDGTRYNIAESVGHQLVQVVSLMRREVEARMALHGLTDAQWKPLWMLKAGRASTANELARETCIDAGAITRMLDRLEAKGLIERVRSETDRRVVHLRLTDAGEAAVANVPPVLASVNNDFLRGLSEREWHQLGKLLERMAENGRQLQTQTDAEAA
jgi:DNA-binding MarR family transcriptional regulator